MTPRSRTRGSARWPEAFQELDVCPQRQMPIPYSTARWPDGRGRFSVNDVARKLECGQRRLCGICGRSLGWWVAFLAQDHGVLTSRTLFTDAPVHEECAEASLTLCPYIREPRVPRRPHSGAIVPCGHDPAQPKTGWLMYITRAYEIVPQPARGGRQAWAFLPGPAKRVRRFAYGGDGVLREAA
jgi:hypothetical protein